MATTGLAVPEAQRRSLSANYDALEDAQYLERLYQIYDMVTMGRILGCAGTTVKKWLLRYGVELRKKGEQPPFALLQYVFEPDEDGTFSGRDRLREFGDNCLLEWKRLTDRGLCPDPCVVRELCSPLDISDLSCPLEEMIGQVREALAEL